MNEAKCDTRLGRNYIRLVQHIKLGPNSSTRQRILPPGKARGGVVPKATLHDDPGAATAGGGTGNLGELTVEDQGVDGECTKKEVEEGLERGVTRARCGTRMRRCSVGFSGT